MRYTFASITVLSLIIMSCSTARKESGQTGSQQQDQVQNTEIVTDAPGDTEIVTPSESNQAISVETASPETLSRSVTAEGSEPVVLNPPHGEPGHSCDIPVGSPLPASETASNEVLNPPHGEPGHRCDIPVGSPLSNAPDASPSATARPAPGASLAPTIENAKRLDPRRTQRSTSTTARSGERLNPPHGQPGHRCEIPVGSPLP